MGNLFSIPENAIIHPTLFAGWVGIFLTAVNLLPAGQLDGGHIARAILKEKHKYISWVVIFVLAGLSFFYTGWLMFAIIILLFIGTQHQPPLNEITPIRYEKKTSWSGNTHNFYSLLCSNPVRSRVKCLFFSLSSTNHYIVMI